MRFQVLAGCALFLFAKPLFLASEPLPKAHEKLAAHRHLTSSAFTAAKEEMIEIYRKLLVTASRDEMDTLFNRFYEELSDYLSAADAATFLQELNQLSEWIEAIIERYNRFVYRTLPYRFSQSYPLTSSLYEQESKIPYITATYCMSRPLTEKQKLELYLLEMANYQRWSAPEVLQGSTLALAKLPEQCIYDFTIDCHGNLSYSVQDKASWIELNTDEPLCIYRLNSPNHSLLAERGDKAECLGSFTLWREGEKILLFAWTSSGCLPGIKAMLAPFKTALIEMGLDEAQILFVPLTRF